MKTWVSLSGGALVVAAALVLSSPALAASNTYNFTIRGDVTTVDKTSKTLTVYPRHVSPLAQNDLAGVKTEFNASGAKFYKYDAKGKKVRITLGSVPVGNEVVVKGAKRGEDRYNISEVTVNSNMFSIVGTVKDQDTVNKTIKIEILSSTYKEAQLKGKTITTYYSGSTSFRNENNVTINADELSNDDERAKLTGIVTNNSKFEVGTVIDGYQKSK